MMEFSSKEGPHIAQKFETLLLDSLRAEPLVAMLVTLIDIMPDVGEYLAADVTVEVPRTERGCIEAEYRFRRAVETVRNIVLEELLRRTDGHSPPTTLFAGLVECNIEESIEEKQNRGTIATLKTKFGFFCA
jgi:hypothetical protein